MTLDMGFLSTVDKIALSLPQQSQFLVFKPRFCYMIENYLHNSNNLHLKMRQTDFRTPSELTDRLKKIFQSI